MKLDVFFLRSHGAIVLMVISVFLWSCQREQIGNGTEVSDHFFLFNEGQYMPVSVRGNVASGKMLLLVHGGPGGNASVYRDEAMREKVEPEVAVVYWDQRFAGGTQGKGGPHSLEVFSEDMRKLIQLLKHRYGQEQEIILLGHSWGGFLCPWFLREAANRDMVKGWIQVGGAHDYRLNDSLTREMLLFYGQQELDAGRETEQWQEIVDWCESNGFDSDEEALQLNQFAHTAETLMPDVAAGPFAFPRFKEDRMPLSLYLSNTLATNIRDIDAPTYGIHSESYLKDIQTPLLMLWGKYDFVCPPELRLHLQQHVSASEKETVIFNASGHSPMMNEPEAFWNVVLNWIER